MAERRVVFRVHALGRMFQRGITIEDVHRVLAEGEVIEDYPTDTPYPSRLILGWCGNRPLHLVVSYNTVGDETIVITAYEPDPQKWDSQFKRRRP